MSTNTTTARPVSSHIVKIVHTVGSAYLLRTTGYNRTKVKSVLVLTAINHLELRLLAGLQGFVNLLVI